MLEATDWARGRGRRPRLALVSGHAHNPLTPRGERTRRLADGFRQSWDVELCAPQPAPTTTGAVTQPTSWLRRRASDLAHAVLLDKWEPWSARRFWRWRPDVDAAFLIGYPFSPPAYASRRLVEAGVPYVVDSGDPWVLTEPTPRNTRFALWRSVRAERRLWTAAAGAVLTTERQAEALTKLFPQLPILVRPSGYTPVPPSSSSPPVLVGREATRLRIAHFGMLARGRLELAPFLAALAATGPWRTVSMAQFGPDYAGMLERVPDAIEVERHPAVSWEEVIGMAGDYDLALVVGNVNPVQLPSKAIQYMTLPIPRLALTAPSG